MKSLRLFFFLFSAFLFVPSYGQSDSATQKAPPTDSSQMLMDIIAKSKIPVLVDFWATWCGPCRLLNPTIEKLEKKYKGRVKFVRVNINIHQGISQYFRISSIPAVFIVYNRNAQQPIIGLNPEEVYTAALDNILEVAKNHSKSPSPPSTQQ
jgi:thioredoxin 1